MIDLAVFARRSQEIIEAGRFLYDNGWSPATSSNYSARLDEQRLAITVSGKHKGQLMPEDIMAVDLEGHPINSSQTPSAETLLHCVLYEMDRDIGAVLHTHSVNATVLSRILGEQPAVVFEDYEVQKAFPGYDSHASQLVIPIFDNTQDIRTLAAESLNYLEEHRHTPAYLIRGHGLYTWGRTMVDALRHVEAIEFLLACELEYMKVTS